MKKVPTEQDYDQWRKRVMASIGGYLREMNIPQSSQVVKAVAVRAAADGNPAVEKARTTDEAFNKIPFDRLRSIYNAFVKRQKDLRTGGVPKEFFDRNPTGDNLANLVERIYENSVHAVMQEVSKLPDKQRAKLMREYNDPKSQEFDFSIGSINEDEYDYSSIEPGQQVERDETGAPVMESRFRYKLKEKPLTSEIYDHIT